MKVAIIGSGPLAIEALLHFDHLGAAATLFHRGTLGGNMRLLKEHFPEYPLGQWSEMTASSAPGTEFPPEHQVSAQEYWDEYLLKHVASPHFQSLVIKGEVIRIHKRFLSPDEEIPGHGRLMDLFRVVFNYDPRQDLEEQLSDNPQAFSHFSEEIVASLHSGIERFQDFDLVIDARGEHSFPLPMGPGQSEAINEKKIEGPIYYGRDAFNHLSELTEKKHLLIVGSGELAALAINKLRPWLSFAGNRLSIVTTERDPFISAKENQISGVADILADVEVNFQNEIKIFEDALDIWRNQEDYIRAKLTRPVPPERRIEIFAGHNIVAIDRLLDQEGLFATIESAPFRSKGEGELKTLGLDAILVFTGHKQDRSIIKGLRKEQDESGMYLEPGLYDLTSKSRRLSEGLVKIKRIEEDVMKFFSRI